MQVGIKSWFLEMIEKYPPMNGPNASDDVDDPKVTDYSIGRSVIYAAFAWSESEDAYRSMFASASKHGLGFFDASGDDGQVWSLDQNGEYACVHKG